MPFITTDRVKQAFKNFDEDDDIILKDLLDGCLAFVKSYCGQNFESDTYYEQHDTSELGWFQLAQRPVQNIIRVAAPATCLTIKNTTASRATISVNDTGVTLQSATNGVAASTTITFASAPTFTALAAAISLVSGWTCSVVAYGNHESNCLRRMQGVPTLTDTLLDGFVTDIQFVLQSPATIIVPRWTGLQTTRCDYVAGYTTCPDDLAMVISELCQLAYSQRQINPTLVSYSNGAYSWSKAVSNGFENMSAPSKKILARYKLPRITGGFIV